MHVRKSLLSRYDRRSQAVCLASKWVTAPGMVALIVVGLAVWPTFSAHGQTPDAGTALSPAVLSKLDPMIARIVRAQGAGRAVMTLDAPCLEVGRDGQIGVHCFVRFEAGRANDTADLVRTAGGQVGTPLPTVMTATIPASRIAQVAAGASVVRLEAAHQLQYNLDVSVAEINADDVHAGTGGSPDAYEGTDVIVGIVDSGIDWSHWDFRNADDDLSRILFVWDQTDTGGPNPSEFAYGTQWTKTDIDDELDGSPANVVRETDPNGHGTHVAGVAAGNGLANGGYVGVAPAADLIVVKTDGLTDRIVDAVDYIFQKAEAADKSAVVNVSLGSNWGPHDGTSAYETSLSDLTGPGKIVCMSAGNAGDNFVGVGADRDTHASYGTSPSSKWTMIRAPQESSGTFYLDIWNDGGTITVSVDLYESQNLTQWYYRDTTGNVLPGGSGTWILKDEQEDPVGTVQIDSTDTNNVGNQCHHVVIEVELVVTAPEYEDFFWRVNTNNTSGSGTLDMWIPYAEDAHFYDRTIWGAQAADSLRTVSGGATALEVIAVGSYVTRVGPDGTAEGDISDVSGIGPSRDPNDTGQKPEITAPGEIVMSAKSSDWTGLLPDDVTFIGFDASNQHGTLQGTSLASAHVTGTIALMLERHPFLEPTGSATPEPDSCEELLVDNARADTHTGAVPNDTWGYGKVDALATMTAVPAYPTIDEHPADEQVCGNDPAELCVVVTGSPPLSYQWQKYNSVVQEWEDIAGVTGDCYTIASAVPADAGDYRCRVWSHRGRAVISNEATLEVKPDTEFTDQPNDQDVCPDATATFYVHATPEGTPFSYQWQKDGVDLTDGGDISGATTDTLQIANADASDEGDYTCVVSGGCGGPAESDAGALTLRTAPSITDHPSSDTKCPGESVTFSVSGSGSDPLSYQWRKDGNDISGATESSYTIASVTADDAGDYDCVASNNCDSATSSAATLTVNETTAITAHPADATKCPGETATFSVTANGTNLTYQWQLDSGGGFGDIPGATDSSYTTPVLTTADDGNQYRCIVDGACNGAVTSDPATLTVLDETSITTHPADATKCPGETATFSVTAAGASLTYQWQLDSGSGFSDIPGATDSSYTTPVLTTGDNGNQYHCVVTGDCGSETSTAATLTVNETTAITSHPADATKCPGETATFSVTADGTNLTYQWQLDSGGGFGDIPGATDSSYTTPVVTTGDNGNQYRCVVTGDCGSETSTAATLTVLDETSLTAHPADATKCPGETATFNVTAAGASLTYQWQVDSGGGFGDIPGATDPSYTTPALTTGDNGNQYRCLVDGACGGLATSDPATLTVLDETSITAHPADATKCPGQTATFSVTAEGTNLTYQWQLDSGGGFGDIPGATDSSYTTPALTIGDNGNQYHCVVTGDCGSETSTAATLTVLDETSITAHPADATKCPGETATFSVTAEGVNLTYQWQLDSGGGFGDIPGATDSSYTTPVLTTGDSANQYRCLVSGDCGSMQTSNAATLTVHDETSITTHPADATECPGQTATFSVTAEGANLAYQWQLDSGTGFDDIAGAIDSSYTTPVLTTGDNGNQYRCVVTGDCGSETSTAATLTVNETTAITSHPADATKCPGETATFSVTADGTNLTYQWQLNSGTGFGDIPGATDSSYTTPVLTTGDNGSQYRCLVDGACNGAVTSDPATLTVLDETSITAHPADATKCPGETATFSVTAAGASLTYQWQVDSGGGFGDIPGATDSSYTTPVLTTGDNGNQYRCVVTGDCGSETSTAATLTVLDETSITAHPADATKCPGETATFEVTAVGADLTYQWQLDAGGGFGDIPGATDPSYTTPVLTTGDNGNQYRCTVDSACGGPVTSDPATLTVLDETSITAHPADATKCPGETATLSVTAAGSDLTYQWQLDSGGGFGDISGATDSSYTTPVLTSGDNGNQYRCVVTGDCGSETSSEATLTMLAATLITSHPAAQHVCPGDTVAFTVSATGQGTLFYQWETNASGSWQDIPGAGGATFQVPNADEGDVGDYRCRVTAGCGQVTSDPAALTLKEATQITSDPSSQDVCEGGSVTFFVWATGEPPVEYQWQKYNTGTDVWDNLAGETSTQLEISSAGSGDAGDYRCVVTGGCGLPVPSDIATLTVGTPPSITSHPDDQAVCLGDEVAFSVTATGGALSYQWQRNTGIGWEEIPGATGDSYTFITLAGDDGNRYRCVVANICGTATSNAATLSLKASTSITQHPQSRSVCPGDDVQFTVQAQGANLTYQWRKDGGDISGATLSVLTLFNVGTSDAGSYTCVVGGDCPAGVSLESDAATLTVKSETQITSHPSNQDVCPGATATFTVTATGGGTLTYQWKKDGGNLPGETASTLTIEDVEAADAGSYTCEVTGECGSVTSDAASLTLKDATEITQQPEDQTVCLGDTATFSVTAGGSSLTYQWQKYNTGTEEWDDLDGQTSAALQITNAGSGDAGDYRCVVDGACGDPVNSDAASLTVNDETSITAHPADVTKCAGQTATFEVTAAGAELTYQWQLDSGGGFGDISGATGSSYTTPTLVPADDGNQYRCVVDGACGSVQTSNAATLTIAAGTWIIDHPVDQAKCPGETATLSVTAEGSDLTYQWQLDSGTGFDDIAGATDSSYTTPVLTTGDDGNQYRCIVDGACGSVQTSNAATLTVHDETSITAHPADATKCPGETAAFSVTAAGTNLTYQWQLDSGSGFADISGATGSSYTTPVLTTGDNGNQYRCVVTGDCGSETSTAATLTVNETTAITAHPADATKCPSETATFSVTAEGTDLTYQWQLDNGGGFSDISGATDPSYTTPSLTSGDDGNQYLCVVDGACGGPVTSDPATLTVLDETSITAHPADATKCPGQAATFSVTAAGSNLTYQWQLDSGGGFGDISGATESSYTTPVLTIGDDGNQYRCVVTGTCGAETSTPATLTVNEQTSITQHPADQTKPPGETATFSVTATGTDLNYQWELDSGSGFGDITGATSSSYTTPVLTAADDGNQYRCVVTGACGMEISNAATLTVASVVIDQWRGVRYHGGPVSAEMPIALNASASGLAVVSETRKADADLKVAVDMTATGAPTVTGTIEAEDMSTHATYAAAPTVVDNGGGSYTLELLWAGGLPDQACYNIDLTGKLNYTIPGDADCMVKVLAGNTNGDNNTDLIDLAQVKSKNGAPVAGDDVRFDVNLDGYIDLIDMAMVKSLNGNSASCP